MQKPSRHQRAAWMAPIAMALLAAPAPGNAEPCPAWERGVRTGMLSNEEISESSGLAHSWRRDDLLWTHNDSGDSARLFALEKDGTVVTELVVEGVEAIDWEDMAIAPCTSGSDTPCIYVGDIGDNLSRREQVTIYRFPEPELSTPPPARVVVSEVEVLHFRYPGGPRDAETLLVHPESAKIYVVEKVGSVHSEVFRVEGAFDGDVVTAQSVATLTFEHAMVFGRMTTAGDISPNGRNFSIRTYTNIFTFCARPGEGFETAFEAEPTSMTRPPITVQGEALTYDRTDGALWLTSEGVPAPLIRVSPLAVDTLPGEEEEEEDGTDAGGEGAALDVGAPPEMDAGSRDEPDANLSPSNAACACNVVSSPPGGQTVPVALAAGCLLLVRRRCLISNRAHYLNTSRS